MPSVIQPSFAKGELAPALTGRVDTAAYAIGLAKARNGIIHTYGGASGRMGTRFIGPVADHGYAPRFIEFQFKTTDKYVLEIGDLYIRFIRNDGHVIEVLDDAITGITQANPGVVTAPAHPFSDGMRVTLTGVAGMTEVNGNTYVVGNSTADTFQLVGIDTTSFTAYSSGGTVTQDLTVIGTTQANPVVVTVDAHGFANNDEVFLNGIGGMTQLNGNRYYAANVTPNTFQLTDQVTGANVDGTGFGAYTSGGTAGKIYEIASPFTLASLYELTFTQSADVMTLVHKDIGIYELKRFDHDSWTITQLVVSPTLSDPSGIQVAVVGATGSVTDRYRVTAIDTDTGEESLPGLNNVSSTITGATQANPIVVTATAHGHSDGDEIETNGVVGMTQLNGNRYYVSNSTVNTFELQERDGTNIDSTNFTAYVSGGQATETFVRITNGNTTRNNTITWQTVADADRYAVYREDNGIFGLIGETEQLTFTDDNINPDVSESHPTFRDPFDSATLQPGAVGFYEQRRVFGGSLEKPDTSEYSQTGNQGNFNKTQPSRSDDAITATLASLQVNEIRHYVGQNDLLVFTSGSEWRVNAGPDAIFGPQTIKQKPQTSWGSSWRPPIVANNTVLFVEENESRVRSFGYSLQIDGYTGSDLTLLSHHLLEGKTIRDWAYARSPESRVYMARSDGAALTMSFEQDQEVVAWTPWDTSGRFEGVAALRGGGTFSEDSVYFVVRRVVNGTVRRYVEVWRQTFFDDVKDAFFVDSGLTYDVPIPITGITQANPGVITATAHGLSNGGEVDLSDIEWIANTDDSFNETQPDQLNGGRFTVANATANTFTLQDEDGVDIDMTSFSAYVSGGFVRLAVRTFSGLDHLEGRRVVALADGNVIGTEVDDTLTVVNGAVTLDAKASRVHIGLSYISDLELLNIESPQGTVQGRRMSVSTVVVRFLKSRGILIGPDSDNLEDWAQREDERFGEPTELFTGDKEFTIQPVWKSNGRVFMRQKDPLPLTVLSVVPRFVVEDDE